MATFHEHWRESLFFILHPRDGLGDVVILTLAHFPARQEMDSLQLGRIGGTPTIAHHVRPYDGDPHTMAVGPVRIDIAEPFRTVHLHVDDVAEAPVALDLTFHARTAAYGLRRGTMRAGHELIWDQSHMVQSGTFTGTFTHDGTTYEVDDWWGQRDHSWGIRNHARVPMWMWLAVQLPDGMAALWHWEYTNGARVYTDGCFAPADGSEPIAVVDVQARSAVDRRGRCRGQLRPRRCRRRRHRRTRRARAGESDGRSGSRPRTLGAAVRRPRRRPQRGDRPHRRRPHGHGDLRAHRRPPPPLLPGPPRRTPPAQRLTPLSPRFCLLQIAGVRSSDADRTTFAGVGFGGTRIR